jgi:hypothetical protein
LIPPSRLDQGVRFIGAAPLRASDLVVILDAVGNLSLHSQVELASAGSVQGEVPLLAFGVLPAPVVKPSAP